MKPIKTHKILLSICFLDFQNLYSYIPRKGFFNRVSPREVRQGHSFVKHLVLNFTFAKCDFAPLSPVPKRHPVSPFGIVPFDVKVWAAGAAGTTLKTTLISNVDLVCFLIPGINLSGAKKLTRLELAAQAGLSIHNNKMRHFVGIVFNQIKAIFHLHQPKALQLL